jgi:thiosulfate/3-mercaptopyruvate sulfurtransferase
MEFKTIISAENLHQNLGDPDWAIMDCRFYLDEPDRGHQDYLESHIPGAIYINLDRDLSGEIIPGKTGRHPLPESQLFTERLSSWGIDNQTQVIVYDNKGGALASRMWWMLRWLGHERVAVLDGAWQAWIKKDLPQESGEISRVGKKFHPQENPDFVVDASLVEEIRGDNNFLLLDARSPRRYWGLEEPIDQKSGHIPGAVNAPFEGNLTEEGYFLSAADLKERFDRILEGVPPSQVVAYCGSGVTATHNLISMVEAGFEMGRLYPGSWSEWITDPERPIGP